MGDVMRGQLSAEMLILIVVVLAIVAIAASQLLNTAKQTAGNINESAGTIAKGLQPCNDAAPCTISCPSGQSPFCDAGVCSCK
jgi:archaellum component FlaG (FlaF/FlaG flagellin family)